MSIIKSIQLLKEHSDMTSGDLACVAELPIFDFNYYLYMKGDLPSASVLKLCEAFNLSYEALCRCDFDAQVAASYFRGERSDLPAKFLTHAYSKIRTVRNIFNYSTDKFGAIFSENLLRRFQISKNLLSDPYRDVSVEIVNGMFERLLNFGATPKDLHGIGKTASLSFLESKFGDECSQYKNKLDFWECVFAENGGLIEYVDKNANYRLLRLSSDGVVIEMSTREWAREYFKCEKYGSEGWAHNGVGFAAGLCVGYNGHMGEAKVLKDHSSGRCADVFQVKFA